jgi:hypothetical protein
MHCTFVGGWTDGVMERCPRSRMVAAVVTGHVDQKENRRRCVAVRMDG